MSSKTTSTCTVTFASTRDLAWHLTKQIAIVMCGVGFGLLVPELLLAQGLPTDTITTKFADVETMMKTVAWGILGVGVIVIAVKLNNGDPDVNKRGWQFFFAALILYMSSEIIEWMKA
jgi:hypothetical protein